jgi:hypothetical protein
LKYRSGPFFSAAGPTRLCLCPIRQTKPARAIYLRGTLPICLGASRTLPISLSTSRVETATHPTRYHSRYPPKPIPFLFSPTWQRRPNCRRRADHSSPPRATRVPACAPAPPEPSHQLWCAMMSHHHCHPSLLQPGCPRQELSDEVIKQASPLAELSQPKARRLDPGVAYRHARVAV